MKNNQVIFLIGGFLGREFDYTSTLGKELSLNYNVHYIGLKNKGFSSNSNLLEHLKKSIEKVIKENKYKESQISFVTHSMGFIALMNALNEYNFLEKTQVYAISGFTDLGINWREDNKEMSIWRKMMLSICEKMNFGPFCKINNSELKYDIRFALGEKDLILNLSKKEQREKMLKYYKNLKIYVKYFKVRNHAFNYKKYNYSPICYNDIDILVNDINAFFNKKLLAKKL